MDCRRQFGQSRSELFAEARRHHSNCILGELNSRGLFDTAKWTKQYREIYHTILYAVVKATLRNRYVGDAAVNIQSSFQTNLTGIKHLVTDSRVNRQYLTFVRNYSDRVMKVILSYPDEQIVPTDVCATLFTPISTAPFVSTLSSKGLRFRHILTMRRVERPVFGLGATLAFLSLKMNVSTCNGEQSLAPTV